jgi:hypothetical protein
MWGASDHLHVVGHHAGHLQRGLKVGGAIVYYVALKIKQPCHFANRSSTSPTAIDSLSLSSLSTASR